MVRRKLSDNGHNACVNRSWFLCCQLSYSLSPLRLFCGLPCEPERRWHLIEAAAWWGEWINKHSTLSLFSYCPSLLSLSVSRSVPERTVQRSSQAYKHTEWVPLEFLQQPCIIFKSLSFCPVPAIYFCKESQFQGKQSQLLGIHGSQADRIHLFCCCLAANSI